MGEDPGNEVERPKGMNRFTMSDRYVRITCCSRRTCSRVLECVSASSCMLCQENGVVAETSQFLGIRNYGVLTN